MKTIEERAKEYAACEYEPSCRKCKMYPLCTIPGERTTFIAGAYSEHEELTKWYSPDNPPENDTPVLLKAIWKEGGLIYYRVGRYRGGQYINDSCPSHNIDVIGWREIHE